MVVNDDPSKRLPDVQMGLQSATLKGYTVAKFAAIDWRRSLMSVLMCPAETAWLIIYT